MSHTLIRGLVVACCLLGGASMAGHAQTTVSSEKMQQANPRIILPRFYSSERDPHRYERQEAINKEVEVFWKPAQDLYKMGDLAGAEKACLQAIAIREKYDGWLDYNGRELLGEIYLKGNQNAKALECFRPIYSNGPDDRIKLDRALAYCRLGDYNQAQRFYTDGYMPRYTYGGQSIDPSNLPSTDNLTELHARVLLVRGFEAGLTFNVEEAIENLQAADKLVSKNPAVHFFWGEALKRLERYTEAIPHYEIAAARGNGVVMKQAKAGIVSARKSIEGMRLWKEQQANKQAATHPMP